MVSLKLLFETIGNSKTNFSLTEHNTSVWHTVWVNRSSMDTTKTYQILEYLFNHKTLYVLQVPMHLIIFNPLSLVYINFFISIVT